MSSQRRLNGLIVVLVIVAALAACTPPPAPVGAPTPSAVSPQSRATGQPAAAATTAPATAGSSGMGRGMMGKGMGGSGRAPGGLTAVTPDGKAIAADPNAQLPDSSAAQRVGDMTVTIALAPYPPVSFQKADFVVTLVDGKGQPITDAQVSLDLTMPAMPMPANKPAASHSADGRYQATSRFTMRDWWRIEVIIQRGGQKVSAFFDVWV